MSKGLRVSAAAAITALSAKALAGSPQHSSSVFIRYANASANQTELTASPQLAIGFDGGLQHRFIMDTGSTGIVVSPDRFQPPANAKPLGPGTKTYTSSGVVQEGDYYRAQVQIGAGQASATADVPVLRVTRVTCTLHARSCAPSDSPTGIGVFGIGFGQEKAGQPGATPDKNPFLNIVQIAGRSAHPSAGYVLTAEGATLGVSAQTARQFLQVRLAWNATEGDWNRAPLTLQVGDWISSGTVLVDTGVQGSYLQPPLGKTVPTIPRSSAVGACVRFAPCAAQGVVIRIRIGQVGAAYGYTIGRDGIPNRESKAAPSWVTVVAPSSDEAFLNTSYHFLNEYDYIYDSILGIVGFREAVTLAAGGSAAPR